METQADFAATYGNMSDGQLLETANEGGLVPEARIALSNELRRRNLKPSDLARHTESPHERLQREAKDKAIPGRAGPTGLVFFGHHYLNQSDRESNIQVRTKFFALGGIPLVPIASYRFKCRDDADAWLPSDEDDRVINRIPLNWNQVLITYAKTAAYILALIAVVSLWVWYDATHK